MGLIFSSDLTWGKHVDYIVAKASKRLYVIYQLIRAGIPVADVIIVYCSLIRSILEYACQVWHCGLTKSQSDEIENVQRRCLRIIFRELSYKDALQITELELLSTRREKSVIKLFNEVKGTSHILNSLLPLRIFENDWMLTRDTYPFRIPAVRTERPLRSFIYYCIKKRF